MVKAGTTEMTQIRSVHTEKVLLPLLTVKTMVVTGIKPVMVKVPFLLGKKHPVPLNSWAV